MENNGPVQLTEAVIIKNSIKEISLERLPSFQAFTTSQRTLRETPLDVRHHPPIRPIQRLP